MITKRDDAHHRHLIGARCVHAALDMSHASRVAHDDGKVARIVLVIVGKLYHAARVQGRALA